MNRHFTATKYELIADPLVFCNEVIGQIKEIRIRPDYVNCVRVLCFFAQRGLLRAANQIKRNPESPLVKTNLLCFTVYKSFVPIFENILLGYPSEVVTLTRSQFERIGILGFLTQNQDKAPRFFNGEDFSGNGKSWLTKYNAEDQWMKLYGPLSGIAHGDVHSMAGYLFAENRLADCYRDYIDLTKPETEGITYSVLALPLLTLWLLEPISREFFAQPDWEIFPNAFQFVGKLHPDWMRDFGHLNDEVMTALGINLTVELTLLSNS